MANQHKRRPTLGQQGGSGGVGVGDLGRVGGGRGGVGVTPRKPRRPTDNGVTLPKNRPGIGIVRGGLDHRPSPKPGLVRFRAVWHLDIGLVAELNGPVTPAGYSQYDTIERKGRLALLDYAGRDPLALTIPLLLDRWTERASVEPEMAMLDQLLGLVPHQNGSPEIIIEGPGIPFAYERSPALRWVLVGEPDWGDDIRTVLPRTRHDRRTGRTTILTGQGERSYVPVTVTARQLVRPTTLTQPRTEPAQGATRSYYTVQHGEQLRTLKQIAKAFHSDWHHLRKLNPKIKGDPDHKLKPGTRVRVQ